MLPLLWLCALGGTFGASGECAGRTRRTDRRADRRTSLVLPPRLPSLYHLLNMGLFSRKKNNKQPSSNPSRAESPSPSDAYSRAESPLPPVPGRSSTSSHFGSTSSLPPNFAHPEPIPQTRRVPDEPYVLPSLSLSPLGIQPIRTRSSSDGRLPGEGVRDSFVLVPPLGLDEDDDDAPLGWRANQNPKAMRFFGLDKDEAARPATVSEDGHGSRGSLGGGEAEGYDFRSVCVAHHFWEWG